MPQHSALAAKVLYLNPQLRPEPSGSGGSGIDRGTCDLDLLTRRSKHLTRRPRHRQERGASIKSPSGVSRASRSVGIFPSSFDPIRTNSLIVVAFVFAQAFAGPLR